MVFAWHALHMKCRCARHTGPDVQWKMLNVMCGTMLIFFFIDDTLLEYITYHGPLNISLNFWLSWFLYMVSEASVIRDHGFKSHLPLI